MPLHVNIRFLNGSYKNQEEPVYYELRQWQHMNHKHGRKKRTVEKKALKQREVTQIGCIRKVQQHYEI